ncbi:unnamed protein product [Nippostrongylus brasiliensis]|uniref:Secreted protein n=1 Tax=Nippostrongylus brasiliensis TaxID=27835 RepID=A0A0N4Y856_NIPBR|nr:unnamed protein product [Nippostrongylus brasiliensis]
MKRRSGSQLRRIFQQHRRLATLILIASDCQVNVGELGARSTRHGHRTFSTRDFHQPALKDVLDSSLLASEHVVLVMKTFVCVVLLHSRDSLPHRVPDDDDGDGEFHVKLD